MATDPSVKGGKYPSIEEVYFRAWGKVGGAGRLRRTFSLFAEFWGMLEFQIRREHSELSDLEVRRQTAKRMYLSDDAARQLLDGAGGQLMEQPDLRETMERITAILEGLGLRFHLTGGVASSFYGDPRFTQDLDLVVELAVDRSETKALLRRLSSGYLINEEVAIDAIERRSLFPVIDEVSMLKIDFHVGEKIPGELSRSRPREVLPGVIVPLVSKEDAILSKLLWIQLGSHKARRDVKLMLKRDEELDRAVLEERATAMGLHDLLVEMKTADLNTID